ncbi:ABC transporter permease [Paludicola sp. MB14-C6]|uniref:ABC transporter permease n=1 Tax=Paludihabitans sp. MB14-C6 TaxID=3070656 RepID=UPI0027DC6E19|nr:ABC transporter permease [Paludicola sp. MB14-C6]WMJ23656.1 ABC transporter permease [Paludicola sp. MB14-C6]
MKKLGKNIYLGLCFLFLYAPIVVLIVFSFNESKSRAHFTGFTLKWYQELFSNTLIMKSLWNTLIIAILASVIATLLGTIAAIGINNMKKGMKTTVMNITYLPVINPEIITGISLMLLFVFISDLFGIELGFITVLISHITFCLPYVILNVLPKLRQMDIHLYEAAIDLGCNPLKAFMKVVIPEILPGITSGFLMAFTFSLDDFVITYFTSGSSFQTLPVTIYSMTRMKVNPQINALSTIMFLIVLALLLLMNIKNSRQTKLKGAGY